MGATTAAATSSSYIYMHLLAVLVCAHEHACDEEMSRTFLPVFSALTNGKDGRKIAQWLDRHSPMMGSGFLQTVCDTQDRDTLLIASCKSGHVDVVATLLKQTSMRQTHAVSLL